MKIKSTNVRCLFRKRQLFEIMKTFIFLFCTTVFSFNVENTFSQEQVIIDTDKEVSVDEVFDIIEDQTKYRFMYPQDLFANAPKIQLKRGAIRISKLLKQSFSKGNVSFSLSKDGVIVLKEKQINLAPIPIDEQSQDIQISGAVTDSSGQPLPGVNIIEKGTTNGVQTDFDGNYSINVSKGDVLIFSFIGMKTQNVTVDDATTINVIMQEDTAQLDEVVVVGYGTQKKTTSTSSVVAVDIEAIESRSVTNISSALSGLVPGLVVQQGSGGVAGGDGAGLLLRGQATLGNGSTAPLLIVDGLQVSAGSFNDIDINDVANISVLKDAGSTAIYGSRAANGVILITTKRGKSGKFTAEYNGYTTILRSTFFPDLITDFATWGANRLDYYGSSSDVDQNELDEWASFGDSDPLGHPNTNWYDVLYGSSRFQQNHNFSFSGGTESTVYRFSLSYLDQEGLVKDNNLKRYGARFNMDSEITKGLKVGGNIFFRWSDLAPVINNNLNTPGTPAIQSPDGRWGGKQYDNNATTNPFMVIESINSRRAQRRLQGSVFASLEPVKDLKFTTNFSLNFEDDNRNVFQTSTSYWDFNNPDDDSDDVAISQATNANNNVQARYFESYTLQGNFLAEYQKQYGNHSLNLLLGYEFNEFNVGNNIQITARDFLSTGTPAVDAATEITGTAGSPGVKEALQSYFGRLSYNYKEKYLLTANYRIDQSSRFNPETRTGYFPSFSAGWRISEEPFMENVNFINELKIRGSWGETGNNRLVSGGGQLYFPYQELFNTGANYNFEGSVVPGVSAGRLVDQAIRWETVQSSEIALEAGLFNNRLTTSLSYYIRKTDDVLSTLPTPNFLGNRADPIVNLFAVENKGFEIELGYRNQFGEVGFNVSAQLAINKNEVTDYFDDITTGGIQEGFPVNSYYGYEVLGIFQNQEEIDNAAEHNTFTAPGHFHYKDQLTEDTDGDGIPDTADGIIDGEDRTIIGDRASAIVYGSTLNFTYKNFDFNLLVQGVADRDRDIRNTIYRPDGEVGGLHPDWLDEWTPENTDGSLPNVNSQSVGVNYNRLSDFWVRDVSYFRLKNLQLGYNFPDSTLNKISFLNKARIYFSMDNVITISNYDLGFDPESVNPTGVPNVQSYVFGINLTF